MRIFSRGTCSCRAQKAPSIPVSSKGRNLEFELPLPATKLEQFTSAEVLCLKL
jgi:hypothetical protein